MMGELRDESGQSANEDGSVKAPYKINQSTFANRLEALYMHWWKHKDKLWGSADFLAISTPPDDIRYLKSSTLILWLLGCEFHETIIVFGSKHIYILCSQTMVSLLESVKETANEAVDVDVVIHAMLKGEDGASKLEDVLHSMLVSKSEVHDTPIVGYIVEESPKGSILEKWDEILINSGFQISDVTDGLSDLFYLSDLYTVKDPNEVSFTKKAAYLTASAMKYFVIPKLKRAIDMEKEFNNTQKAILYPRIEVKLNADNVDICYPPIFESGGKFDLRRIATSDDDYIIYESPTLIICAIGSRYNNGYYVARTFLVDANAFQSTAYKVLLRAYEAAINAVKPGNIVSDVYLAAFHVVWMADPELMSNLTMTVGTCFGLELHVSGLPIYLINDQVIKAGLPYNISLGFQNLNDTGNLKSQTFSLLLGDTVVVRNDKPEVITRLCSKDVKEVAYSSNDTEEELEPEVKIVYSGNSALYSKTRSQSNKHEISKEELQRQFQAELALRKNEEPPKELAREDSAAVYNWANLRTSNELIGSQHNNLCTNAARRFLIDGNAILSKAYTSLSRAHKAATNAVKPGNIVLDVYNAAIVDVQMSAPELVPNLTCIGIEFGESGLSLDLENDQEIKAGMVFNIGLGFRNLLIEAGNPQSQIFSLLLEDMVVVTNSGCDVITRLSSKDVKDVVYSFSDGYEEVELRVKALYSQEILKTARQFAGRGWGSLNTSNELIAYKSVNDLPPPSETMIQVDQKNEAVLLPIHGILVPFHIATVKRVSSLQDTNNNCYIRIIFNVPGTSFTPRDDANSLKGHGAIYLKEASFLSKDPRHVSEVVQQIKTLRRYVLARESDIAERATLAVPGKLELAGNNCKPIRLSHLLIRPPFGGPAWEIFGALEAFANCFRYSTPRKDEGVDIMYANIRHAFFQPAEKENEKITLLHLHLYKYVMVGNKKTRDVQFYTEVVRRLGVGKPSTQHTDDTEEDQKKRERDKINMDFHNFVNDLKVHHSEFKGLNLEFEQPLRELGFHGVVVPYNIKVFIVPTSSCLVELIETPSFLVITLSEIEIVSLERIGIEGDVRQNDFDMAIVFKDFKRDVIRIDSIPSTSFYGIIDWLENAGIRYYVNGWNRNWQAILKSFSDDPQLFIKLGGWDFLKQEAESDSAVEPSPDSETDSMSDYDDGGFRYYLRRMPESDSED